MKKKMLLWVQLFAYIWVTGGMQARWLCMPKVVSSLQNKMGSVLADLQKASGKICSLCRQSPQATYTCAAVVLVSFGYWLGRLHARSHDKSKNRISFVQRMVRPHTISEQQTLNASWAFLVKQAENATIVQPNEEIRPFVTHIESFGTCIKDHCLQNDCVIEECKKGPWRGFMIDIIHGPQGTEFNALTGGLCSTKALWSAYSVYKQPNGTIKTRYFHPTGQNEYTRQADAFMQKHIVSLWADESERHIER